MKRLENCSTRRGTHGTDHSSTVMVHQDLSTNAVADLSSAVAKALRNVVPARSSRLVWAPVLSHMRALIHASLSKVE